MTNPIRFCLVLHNHQPVGNFDGVFEQAYQDSYLPFLDVFEPFSNLSLSLHTSGPLLEWLDDHHPAYVDRLARLVAAGRIEIVGGAYYEPILTMIPSRDRIGQITRYTQWLESRLEAHVQGMWVPERVWEQSLTSDVVQAGIKYTVLDDFHFRNAGLTSDQLHGYYLTEDDGRLLSVFPGSERLRYLIPFAPPHETIEHLRGIADRFANAVVVFGDDGEKFGTWPDTKQHVYQEGWLRTFLEALSANREWLHTTTLAEAAAAASPWGKVYLPDASYREMTEWALPTERQLEYDDLVQDLREDERWLRARQYMRGGFWRNFKVKYPEANEMYSRMMMVSRRFAEVEQQEANGEQLDWARRALYRAQCNCPYWHGAFGGIYLPHLRNAVFNQMIAADNLLDQAMGKEGAWIEATVGDYNFDARQEVRVASDRLVCLLAPAVGGHMYELDVRTICHNLLATFARRPESYHRKIVKGADQQGQDVASIHDRVIFKQEGLDQRLQYDPHLRKSMLDHFYTLDTNLQAVRDGCAAQQGDFLESAYEARIRRNPNRIQVLLTRDGSACGLPLRITKGVTATAGSSTLEIAYLLEGLPVDRPLHFGVEFNFAGLPSHADDRFFYQGNHVRLGPLHTQLDLQDTLELSMVDQWLGIDVRLIADQPTSWWTFPIETVSNSEGGFELVHQSVVVHPHWLVRADAAGRWSVTFQLQLDTSLAERRMQAALADAAAGSA
ncbi:MAG: alpha-amylase/4-alpha-glucanotransferase domain-containing protein [Pirellulaceae bacterium]